MRVGVPGLTLTLVLGTASSLLATSVIPLSWSKLVGEADVVVRARVGAVEVGWGTHLGKPAIVTRYSLEAKETLKGEGIGDLTVFGGTVGEQTMTLQGQPGLAPGEEVFLFVLRREVQCPFVGVWQGVYRIHDGQVFREGRPVVDLVEGEVVLGKDNERGMAPAQFASEVKRTLEAIRKQALAGEEPR